MNEWTVTLGAFTGGAGTDYELLGPITGLGNPQPDAVGELERGGRDGSVAGPDRLPKRALGFPFGVHGDSPSDAWANFEAAQRAWRHRRIDVELDLRLPGIPTAGRSYFGRPRGATPRLDNLKSGELELACVFDCLDPVGYAAAVTTATFTTLTLDSLGTYDTDRATITIVGNGGTPRFENTTDDGHHVAWSTPLAGAAVRIIDLRRQAVTDGDGVSTDDEISTASLWPILLEGENDLELVGAASAVVTFRPAYL